MIDWANVTVDERKGKHVPGAIQTINLTKTYGKNRGIRDVNLDIHAGEVFGFLGPNGAGKSTTLRTLTALMKPTSGECRIMGIDPHQDPVAAMANVGNLPTEFSLEDRGTGRRLVNYFGKLRNVHDLSFADEIAKRIDADLDRPIRKLSRGNKQKIGIVLALFHRPPVVILDEPTGGLDPLVQEQVMEILTEARAGGQTILFSSHVLSEVERIADRVGIIREGELIAVEDPHQLTSRAIRKVRIRYPDSVDPGTLQRMEQLAGVEQFQWQAPLAMFDYAGNAQALIAALADQRIEMIDIERPSLEEIFLGYYGASKNGGAQ